LRTMSAWINLKYILTKSVTNSPITKKHPDLTKSLTAKRVMRMPLLSPLAENLIHPLLVIKEKAQRLA
jgi:hypothetical protein